MILLSTKTATVIKENKIVSANMEYPCVFLWIRAGILKSNMLFKILIFKNPFVQRINGAYRKGIALIPLMQL